MRDAECVQFLRSILPGLRLRWAGFRGVRRQVCKRLGRRVRELNLPDLDAYRTYLDAHPQEWTVLDGLCRVTISRFFRDRAVWSHLEEEILPALASAEPMLRCWSAGCASGEEPYTLAVVWRRLVQPHRPAAQMMILATDVDARVLERAREGCYADGTLKELPAGLRDAAFVHQASNNRLRDEYRHAVEFRRADIRHELPDGTFHLVLCRNLVFTYFDEPLQRDILARLEDRIVPGGVLIIGRHESLPGGARLTPWRPGSSIFVHTIRR